MPTLYLHGYAPGDSVRFALDLTDDLPASDTVASFTATGGAVRETGQDVGQAPGGRADCACLVWLDLPAGQSTTAFAATTSAGEVLHVDLVATTQA